MTEVRGIIIQSEFTHFSKYTSSAELGYDMNLH